MVTLMAAALSTLGINASLFLSKASPVAEPSPTGITRTEDAVISLIKQFEEFSSIIQEVTGRVDNLAKSLKGVNPIPANEGTSSDTLGSLVAGIAQINQGIDSLNQNVKELNTPGRDFLANIFSGLVVSEIVKNRNKLTMLGKGITNRASSFGKNFGSTLTQYRNKAATTGLILRRTGSSPRVRAPAHLNLDDIAPGRVTNLQRAFMGLDDVLQGRVNPGFVSLNRRLPIKNILFFVGIIGALGYAFQDLWNFVNGGTSRLGSLMTQFGVSAETMERVREVARPLAESFEAYGPVLAGVAGALTAVGVAMRVLNTVMKANPIMLIMSLVAGLAQVIISNWQSITSTISGLWSEFMDCIPDVVKDVLGIGGGRGWRRMAFDAGVNLARRLKGEDDDEPANVKSMPLSGVSINSDGSLNGPGEIHGVPLQDIYNGLTQPNAMYSGYVPYGLSASTVTPGMVDNSRSTVVNGGPVTINATNHDARQIAEAIEFQNRRMVAMGSTGGK